MLAMFDRYLPYLSTYSYLITTASPSFLKKYYTVAGKNMLPLTNFSRYSYYQEVL